jgi:hypothetical protein
MVTDRLLWPNKVVVIVIVIVIVIATAILTDRHLCAMVVLVIDDEVLGGE